METVKAIYKDKRIALVNVRTTDTHLLNDIARIPDATYDKKTKRASMPIRRATGILIKRWKIKTSDTVRAAFKRETQRQERPFKKQIKNFSPILYPFQRAGVRAIEKNNGNILIADDMGLGKTIQTLAYLARHPEIRPAVVVCPASLKTNWQREIKNNMTGESVYIATGRTPQQILHDVSILVINYDILHNGRKESWRDTIAQMRPQLLVVDEIHYAKNQQTKRARALIQLAQSCPRVIGLTGTAIQSRPAEAFTPIQLIDPTLFRVKTHYMIRYCAAHHNGFRWDTTGAANTDELHFILCASIMIRRRKEDVLKQLPTKRRVAITIDIDNRTEYATAEKEFITWLMKTDPRAADRAAKAEAVTKVSYLKHLCAAGKLKATIEWVENFLTSTGNKLVVFNTFHTMTDGMRDHFADRCVALDGRTPANKRQAIVDAFNNDDKIRVFVGGLKSIGTGLNLQSSCSDTLHAGIGWTPGEHDQAEDRVHRIGQTKHVCAYYLICNNTIEEPIARIIDNKRRVVRSILDGENVTDADLLTKLMKEYRQG